AGSPRSPYQRLGVAEVWPRGLYRALSEIRNSSRYRPGRGARFRLISSPALQGGAESHNRGGLWHDSDRCSTTAFRSPQPLLLSECPSLTSPPLSGPQLPRLP